MTHGDWAITLTATNLKKMDNLTNKRESMGYPSPHVLNVEKLQIKQVRALNQVVKHRAMF